MILKESNFSITTGEPVDKPNLAGNGNPEAISGGLNYLDEISNFKNRKEVVSKVNSRA